MIAEVNGLKIEYSVSGAGENVLLLHGWGCTKETFQCVADRLKKSMRVWALDFPGHGGSPEPPSNFGVDDYSDLTAAFIRMNGIAGTHIICHSFGGRVAALLAAKHPELVGKIVFTDAAGIRPKRTIKYYYKIYKFKLLKRVARSRFLVRLFHIDTEAKIKNAGSADYRALSSNMRGIFSRTVNQDLTRYYKDIKAPSLLIWGENDQDTPVSYAKIIEKAIPDAGLVVLQNAGHFSFLDSYATYMIIVENFLGVDS